LSFRTLTYPNQIADSSAINDIQQQKLIDIGDLWEAVFSNSTVVWGLPCSPTGPASLSVVIGRGGITQFAQVDATAPGDGEANTNSIVKQGSLEAPKTITFTAPGTTGQSVNYLIEANFDESDDNSATLDYIDPSTGDRYTGNSSVSTHRTASCSLQVKAGTAASTGSQTTPGADAGWTALYIVTVNNGQTAITSNNIVEAANVPWASNQYAKAGDLALYLTVADATNTYVKNSQLSTGSTGSTVAQRDSSGGLTAVLFHGKADSAAQADNATTAGYAANSGTAANALHAALADLATYATNANASNTAVSAQTATWADNATMANSATSLNSYVGDVNATPSTVALRDASGNINAVLFNGEAIKARFADLGERFEASEPLEEGDVVKLGGDKDIIKATSDDMFGVVSAAPGVRMDEGAGSDSSHPFVCWSGKVPVKVLGSVKKGDFLVMSSIAGVASALTARPPFGFGIIGRALADRDGTDVGLVMAACRVHL
jgi:hypothetical protein